MCFNKDVSILSFLISILGGLTLIKMGDQRYKETNKKIALFFIWVGFMQLVEFLIWIDLDCSRGINRFAGIIGPILNYLQPVIFILLFYNRNHSFIVYPLLIYLFIVIVYYIKYILKGNFCSGKNILGHLKWSWSDLGPLPLVYSCITLLLGYYIYKVNNKYINLSYILGIILFIISYLKFNKNLGELWCFFVVGIPLFVLLSQKLKL